MCMATRTYFIEAFDESLLDLHVRLCAPVIVYFGLPKVQRQQIAIAETVHSELFWAWFPYG